jgi:chemotaxis family two-component system response regulator Rcp1
MPEVNILLIEDNSQDVLLVKEALKDSRIDFAIQVASDGEAAMQVLYSAEFRPHIILLDLNLPKKTGIEVLKEIKRDSSLRPIPVIVLTNSRSEDDVILAYANHCNAYVRKPLGFDGLVDTINRIGHFWFVCATLPKQGSPDLSMPPSSADPLDEA